MKKILKAITFLSLAMCLMLNTSVVYAGGRDETIFHGNNKRTIYASHETLEKMVEDEKKQAEDYKLGLDEIFKYVKYIPVIGQIGGFMYDVGDSVGKIIKHCIGDATFLTDCRDKSANNGKSGCIMKHTYIVHDETPDEWHPDSCEVQ